MAMWLSKNDQRIYFSGDTEDIPEMRALQILNIGLVLYEPS